uniref:Variant surface glycoprotein 1125.5710 n=1 Tax=Trypanosoma brucei TaxID=5691 RepID=A0A1J0RCT0_9TRYP|nr:variant surface glycoprotein 1125.5710 [Trypanosoma brucei]
MLKADSGAGKMIIRSGKPNGLQGNCDGSLKQLNGVDIKATAVDSKSRKKLIYSTDRETVALFPVQRTTMSLTTAGACTVSATGSGFGPSGSSCGTAWSTISNPTAQPAAARPPVPQAIYKGDSVGGECAVTAVPDDDHHKDTHALLKATCETRKVYNQPIDSVADLTLDTVLENKSMILAVRNSDEQFKSLKGRDVDRTSEKFKTTMKALLGGCPETFTELFITKITDEDFECREAEKTAKAKREALAQKATPQLQLPIS